MRTSKVPGQPASRWRYVFWGGLILVLVTCLYAGSYPLVIRVARVATIEDKEYYVFYTPNGGWWRVYGPLHCVLAANPSIYDAYRCWAKLFGVEREFTNAAVAWEVDRMVEREEFVED